MECRHCGYAAADADERCRLRSLGFEGRGLLNINKALSRLEWELSFRLATISHDGVLLFSGDRSSDFVEISIHDRVLQAEFSLGGKPKLVRMENERKNRVNDGEWHTVQVLFYDRHLTVVLDECDPFVALHAHGSAPCAAQARIDLPAKCVDPSVPCFRFLDVYNGIFLGGRPALSGKVEQGYSGCLANLTLSGELVDFSSLEDMDVRGTVHQGCKHRKDFCAEGTCGANAKCVNRWNGANCRCPHSSHHKGACSADLSTPNSRPLTLSDDESFIIYRPEEVSVPFTLSFEFRTSRMDTQIIVVEFEKRSTFYRIELDDSLLRVWLGQTSVLVDAPEMHPGHWTRVEVEFKEEEVKTVVDGIYEAISKHSMFDVSLDQIYTGLAPSTGHPSRFEGCLRDLAINSEPQPVAEKGKVRQGCIVPNRCSVDGVCPRESSCQREWNRHTCRCHRGFAGDTCLPVCSLPGICASNGFCMTTNNTRGYDCQCQPGFVGVNCERSAAVQACLSGYWGKFPHCKKCVCAEGFEAQCDKENGECKCPVSETRFWRVTARQSCPSTQSGLATRACDSEGRWQEVNTFNCTRPEYAVMVSKYDVLSSVELLAMLHNATRGSDAVEGRNLDIARTALERILDAELKLNELEQNHLKDAWFTESLAVTAGKISAHEQPENYVELVRKLAEYGRAVFRTHEQMPYLQPFQFASEHIVFSMDALDFSNTVPKYNNFIDHRPSDFPRILIHLENATRVFYSILAHPRCLHCDTPIVTVFSNTNQPIRIEFELDESTGWRYPECVALHSSHSSWTTRQAQLIALNLSHAMCEFESGGVYTVFAKQDSGSYLRLSHSTTAVSPVLAGTALMLCLISIVLTLARRGAGARLIRLGFVVTFILNALNLYFLNKVAVNQAFCPVRNAVLSFTSLAPFAWLFLYSLHLYRMLAEGRSKSNSLLCFLLGVLIPALLGCVSFLLATQCSVAPNDWLFWTLVVPIALMLLLSFYASTTSFLVSTNKQFDVIVVKFHLRRALCQHFLLCSLTLLHTTVALFSSLFNMSSPLKELINNITLVVAALYILIWSMCPGGKDSPNTTATMWLDAPQKSVIAESTALRCESPDVEDESKHENWAPEAIPCDPFLTSTPIKDQRTDSRERERENPLASAILSPADKILSDGLGHVYGNMGTLTRFRTDEDDADDAYYTYTASRRYKQSTFNRT
ncbi:laminin G domain protein [Oesophagostomum dentatum]|uniref:Laminin G domain protein n=1 Tax=Oesophagostomum dentatum TaxID=61180 RepID=A0A0B1TRQ1_OESDE|nr:laminin G domain protein [Oesophagostomum dentatum]